MKYCSHCGAQLDESALFCPKCGCACENFYNPSQTSAPNNSQNTTNNNNSISGIAIVGFIFAFIYSIAGLICSIVAYKSAITDENLKSKSFAKIGIVLSVVFFVLKIIIVIGCLLLIIFLEPVNAPYEWYY